MLGLDEVDRQVVLGELKKAGSRDRDVLFATKERIMSVRVQAPRMMGLLFMIMGAMVCLTLVGVVVGIPMIWFGRKIKKLAERNAEIVEAVYAEHVAVQSA